MQATLNIVNYGDCSSRRQAALETLTAILTALNVSDYDQSVDLFRSLARILRRESEETTSVIAEAMRVISTMGAINPVKIRKILILLQSDEIEDKEVVVTPGLAHYKPRLRVHPNIGEKYPSVVLYFLVEEHAAHD
ncbi:hypothetical protein STCU_11957 [Strigomonas culicis]|uniref:Serine/threonine-protein kinase mTOR domain-containing protein n=1 Tax=Strigomonas culicis TaxID=28005 RepID=S9ULF9_9TRYP|nr:hypothetical protein STCU_11957 [Strigomonas culicis]|eukprot:EPY15521.1 hypothetical protein STCU_11957 [Strigomonas culicis]